MLDKIDQLRKAFKDGSQESKDMIEKWDRDSRVANAYIELEKNEVIQIIIEDYQKRISTINTNLLHDEKMTPEKRRDYFVERKHLRDFINYFVSAKNQLKDIERSVDEELV